jgi:tetratricopeptide (TPR) repeat protein
MLSRFRRRWASGGVGARPSRRLSALGVSSGLVLLAIIPAAIAQSSRRAPAPPPGLQSAVRALMEGRYDEVAPLTEKLDQQDPNVAAVRARALIARGRYSDAEALLRPIAVRAPTSDAALELGLLLETLGRSDASGVLQRVASAAMVSTEAQELGRAARALRALGRFEDANATYRDAVSLAPKDAALNAAWGELFLETFNNAEALKSFQTALELDAKFEPALLGVAVTLAGEDPPKANAAALKALEINPSDVAAHVFLASQAIDSGKRDEARKVLDKALAVNPASLEVMSLVAALDFVEDKKQQFDAQVASVLKIAPNYGEIYRVAGDLAARNYRFDDAVMLVREAMKLRPGTARSLGDLGLHLLRTGDEPGARQALEASFKINPYDVVTYNLLQMMDTLDTFVTIEDGNIIMKMHKDEAPVLQEYAVSLAHRALDTLGKRYQFTPKGPILIEIFPKHDDFAVRTLGLPGMIGALGVCFGRVVTMDSPRARPPGEFQWEATLWHELAHVITLQMTNQRLPRWASEGISGYEEALAKPEWGRGQDLQFATMLNAGEEIKLKDLNAAFTNPRTISIAYFQAALFIEHLVKTYGDAGLHRLLRAYGKGLDGDAALKEAFNTDFDSLQTGFDALVESRFGAMRRALKAPDAAEFLKAPVETLEALAAKNPGSYPVHAMLGRRLREAGRTDDALKAFERAAELLPLATGEDSPNMQIAEIALEKKDFTRAIAALQAVVNSDFDNVEAARRLVAVMRDANVTEPARVRPVYERIVAIDPFDSGAHSTLGRLALGTGDATTAIREFRAVIALKPVDQAEAHTDLAEAYLRGGQRVEARRQTLAALEIAPSYERAQDLLLKLAETKP